MLATIKIRKIQLDKLNKLLINEKLPFAITDSKPVKQIEVNGPDLEIILTLFSGDPGDLFTLGQKFSKIPDPVIMGG